MPDTPDSSGPSDLSDLSQLFQRAGRDLRRERLTKKDVAEAQQLLEACRSEPSALAAEVLRTRRAAAAAEREGERMSDAVGQLENLLEGLLGAPSVLCRVEGVRTDAPEGPRVCCIYGGQLRELGLHPDVSLESVRSLESWEFACVHATELVVTGVHRDPELFARAHGEVAEFRGWQDKELGLVRVTSGSHGETIVSLPSTLREAELRVDDGLVLQRDDPSRCIARVERGVESSPYEVALDTLETTFDDLVGLDDIAATLIEDVMLRLVHPEIRTRFDLAPLKGGILYSTKAGMGKTALVRALGRYLSDLGDDFGYDFVLYSVRPNELKSMWHGGDAKKVRELCDTIYGRQARPRTRPLIQMVVFDEVESLGRRAGSDDARTAATSSAHNDVVQSLLAEMDGVESRDASREDPPAHVLWLGLTNRPALLDPALRRAGRFGDVYLEVPDATIDVAEGILAAYCRAADGLPFQVDGELRTDLTLDEVRAAVLRPALEPYFEAVCLRATSETGSVREVTLAELLAGVHYKETMSRAKKRAARRTLFEEGVEAVTVDDVATSLLETACEAARQLDADRTTLQNQLRLEKRVVRVELVPFEELLVHRYVDICRN